MNSQASEIPLLSRVQRGGPSRDGRRGGVGQVIDFLIEPPRRFAAPLLCQGGEFALFQFIHTLCDRAYIRGMEPLYFEDGMATPLIITRKRRIACRVDPFDYFFFMGGG